MSKPITENRIAQPAILSNSPIMSGAFRFNSRDPDSRPKLDELLREVGVYLPKLFSSDFDKLIDNLLWRKTASTSEGDGDTTLQVLLDLGEGDEVLLATIRAGEISTFRHALS